MALAPGWLPLEKLKPLEQGVIILTWKALAIPGDLETGGGKQGESMGKHQQLQRWWKKTPAYVLLENNLYKRDVYSSKRHSPADKANRDSGFKALSFLTYFWTFSHTIAVPEDEDGTHRAGSPAPPLRVYGDDATGSKLSLTGCVKRAAGQNGSGYTTEINLRVREHQADQTEPLLSSSRQQSVCPTAVGHGSSPRGKLNFCPADPRTWP